MLAVGVKVAVQVMPPSLLLTAVNVPLAIVRSALVKPVTASLKVMVTSAGFADLQGRVGDHDAGGRAHGVDDVVIGVGGTDAGVPRPLITPVLSRVMTLVYRKDWRSA